MLSKVLKEEGGFVNHPKDPGGATNKGITIATYRSAYGSHKTIDDLKNITDQEIEHIYKTKYYTQFKIDSFPENIQDVMFDMYVNHRPSTAGRILQLALQHMGKDVTADGVVGPKTLTAAHSVDSMQLRKTICDMRINYYERLIANNPSQSVFEKGWKKRARSYEVLV